MPVLIDDLSGRTTTSSGKLRDSTTADDTGNWSGGKPGHDYRNTRPISTAVSLAPAYILPARLPYVDSQPIHGGNLNVNRSQSDGVQLISATVVSTATIGNSIPFLNSHVVINILVRDNHNQVESTQRNIMQHYSTKWKLQQVMELSAVDEEIRRLHAKQIAIVAWTVDPFTLTLNPKLSAPSSATLNPFAQPFASTLFFPIP